MASALEAAQALSLDEGLDAIFGGSNTAGPSNTGGTAAHSAAEGGAAAAGAGGPMGEGGAVGAEDGGEGDADQDAFEPSSGDGSDVSEDESEDADDAVAKPAEDGAGYTSNDVARFLQRLSWPRETSYDRAFLRMNFDDVDARERHGYPWAEPGADQSAWFNFGFTAGGYREFMLRSAAGLQARLAYEASQARLAPSFSAPRFR